MKGVSKKDAAFTNSVIEKGISESRWYSYDEFADNFQRQAGYMPSDRVRNQYETYRALHDVAYITRNNELYRKAAAEGAESLKFTLGGRTVDIDGVVNWTPKKKPLNDDVWDAESGRWLDKDVDLEKMAKDGWVQVKLTNPFDLPNGDVAHFVMVRRGDLEIRPLRRIQLNYSMGGSRAYNTKWFAKQARTNGVGSLLNPRTFIAGMNPNDTKAWARVMNEAIDYAKTNKGKMDIEDLRTILSKHGHTPSAEEFQDLVDANKIDINNHIEVVHDREMPSQYFGKNEHDLRYVDASETSAESYERSMGRLYYGEKGEHLKDYTGKPAELINPLESLNKTLVEATRTTGLSGYKDSMLTRFKDTYGGFLDLDTIDTTDSLYKLAEARIKPGVPLSDGLVAQIKNEQAALRRILRFETKFERSLRETNRNIAEWVLGSAREGTIRDRLYHSLSDSSLSPVEFLRSMAFDLNLGFFNVGQLFIQSSTLASAIALYGPIKGAKAVPAAAAMVAYSISKYSDNVLDVMAKKGIHKLAGFKSEEEFKQFAHFLRDSGVDTVTGSNLSMINSYGSERVFGAASKWDVATEKGRMFFYAAEQLNRSGAARIAWDILTEKGMKPGSSKFKEEFIRLTNDYSMSMMNHTTAGFQHGLASIPTQFWAYSFRMAEVLGGKTFTKEQKIRFLLANFAMAGTAGIPFGFIAEKTYEHMTGEPTSFDQNAFAATMERGLIDALAYVATDADVRIGDKVGTMDTIPNTILDFLNLGEYGDKSLLEVATGATGGKIGSVVPTMWDVLYYSSSVAAGWDEAAPIAKDAWIKMAREIQTLNFTHNAYIAYNYNEFYNKSGDLVADALPDADSFFFALGFNPAEMDEMSYYNKINKENKTTVNDAAKIISRWRQQAFTRPDTYEENRQKELAFMQLFSPSEKRKILRRAFEIKDPSMSESIKRRVKKELQEGKFYDAVGEGLNENERLFTDGE